MFSGRKTSGIGDFGDRRIFPEAAKSARTRSRCASLVGEFKSTIDDRQPTTSTVGCPFGSRIRQLRDWVFVAGVCAVQNRRFDDRQPTTSSVGCPSALEFVNFVISGFRGERLLQFKIDDSTIVNRRLQVSNALRLSNSSTS
jgi:hypothetical protein